MIEARVGAAVRTRSMTDLLMDQLRGIEAWTHEHPAVDLCTDTELSREGRLDAARRRDVVERQRHALVEWTEHRLRDGERVLRTAPAPRVLLAHRNGWFKGKVATALAAGGIAVVAELDNGADAIGVAAAEQPDLVLLEDKLPMVAGLDVTRALRRYAPHTAVMAQVANEWEIEPFVASGAASAYPRRIPPGDIAADLLTFLSG